MPPARAVRVARAGLPLCGVLRALPGRPVPGRGHQCGGHRVQGQPGGHRVRSLGFVRF